MAINDELRRQHADRTLMTPNRIQTKLIEMMSADERVMFEVCKVLFDPNQRGLGRSTAMFAAQIVLAVENPGREIEVIDHTYGHIDTPASMRHAASTIEGLLSLLPKEDARCFKLTGHRMGFTDRLTICYTPSAPVPMYKEK